MTHHRSTSFAHRDGTYRVGAPWRAGPALSDLPNGRWQADHGNGGPVIARAAWLEDALKNLPVVDPGADWKTVVFQRHARRQAEFAIAATLRSAQMGRAMITMSDSSGTSISMFGVRASSSDGFAAAAALWVAAAREQEVRGA